MSIARKADLLPVWTEARGVSGFYGPNSVVYYQKTPNVAGYAYRAKLTYISSNIPPDEDINWEIDYTFSSEWKPDGKYKYGSRVYYFNGQRTYAYIASRRYFGGNGKPNEEVDDDLIRTWELDANYIQSGYYSNYKEFKGHSSHLFPVRKIAGYNGGDRVWPYNPIYPEERYEGRYQYDMINGTSGWPLNPSLDFYLYEKNYVKKDYSDINSKYQSYAYDNRTYVFTKDKANSDGVYENTKKGEHFAKWRKRNSTGNWTENNPNYYAFGESQLAFTSRSSIFLTIDYYDIHGFSIEMWPNIQENEYALVPTTSVFSYYFWDYNNGIQYSADVWWGKENGYINNQGIYLSGPHTDPNNGSSYAGYPPDDECKGNFAFYRTSPAFNDLNCKYCFNTVTQGYKWDPYPVYTTDPNTGVYYLSHYYYSYKTNGDPSYGFFYESTTTKDEDFKSNEPYLFLNFPRNDKNGNALDVSGYKKSMTTVDIGFAGWKVD